MVKIVVLDDNRCHTENLECEHGLSLLIEIDNKKILFDTGQTNIYSDIVCEEFKKGMPNETIIIETGNSYQF